MTSRSGGGDQVTTNDSTHVASQNQHHASTRLSQEANSLFDTRNSNRDSDRLSPQADNTSNRSGNERNSDSNGADNNLAGDNRAGDNRGGDNRSGDAGSDNRRDNGTRDQGDSKKTAQNDQFLDIPPIWDTRAMSMGGAATKEKPGAPKKPGEPAAPKPGDPVPGRNMVDGPVVQLTTRFGGTNRPANHGTGFLVGPEGQRNEPVDGKRFIATAHHVVGHNDVNDETNAPVHETLGENFKKADGNGDNVLSRKEIGNRINDLNNAPKKDSRNKEQSFQFNHLKDNFDEISKVSKEVDPSAPDGISEKGLKEYYRRNTDITVDTKRGTFKAELVDARENSDAALLQMKLDPAVEKALGNNVPFARDLPAKGEKVKAEGYPGIQPPGQDMMKFHRVSNGQFFMQGVPESKGRHVSQTERSFQGMSGGPTLNKKGEAFGVNSGDSEVDGKNYVFSADINVVKDMLRRQKGR